MTQSMIWFKSNVAVALILFMQGFVQSFRLFQKRKPRNFSRLFFPDCLLKSNSLQVHVKKINFLYYENLPCPEAYGLFNFDIKPRDRHKPIGQFC
jgi:hypothetical protein